MAGIYIHVPFCKQKCSYCDFASYPKELNKVEAYFACLYREIKGRGLQLENYTFDTIYFGGGTPSIVNPEYIAGAIRQIKKYFKLSDNPEITIEINPGTIDENKTEVYKKSGINRFSIGLQSGYDDVLKRLGRVHTAKDFLICANMLGDVNKSVDILIGLYDQTKEQLQKTIDLAIAGGVKHISMYALTCVDGTPIYNDYLNGLLPLDDEIADLYDFGRNYLKEKGFERYEISNFSLTGYESKHNINYWKRGEYVGLGASASGFLGNERYTNLSKLDDYMNAVIVNRFPVAITDVIDETTAENELIMLGLRTVYGVNVNEFNVKFNADFVNDYKKALRKVAEYIDFDGNVLKIKDEYLYVQNEIVIEFFK